jgi:hypothetical protein
VRGQRHTWAALYPRERTAVPRWRGGWVGVRLGLDTARGKILRLCRGSNPVRPVCSQTLYCLGYSSLVVTWQCISFHFLEYKTRRIAFGCKPSRYAYSYGVLPSPRRMRAVSRATLLSVVSVTRGPRERTRVIASEAAPRAVNWRTATFQVLKAANAKIAVLWDVSRRS